MNSKNKKIFIISGVVAAIGIIVAIVIAQSKKKASLSTAPSTAGSTPATTTTPSTTTTQPTSTSGTGFAPAATNPAAQTTTTVPTTTTTVTQPTASSGVGAYQYVNAFLEGGVLKIQYQPINGRAFSVGDNIKFITGNPFLLGKTARISQVYNFNSGGLISGPGQNLTVDIPYSTSYQNGKGTFDLV